MNAKHRKTLERVFAKPTPANLRWSEIEGLLSALGASVTERAGSRVAVDLNGVTAVFHRPHPQPEARRPAVRSVARFLENAGVTHE